MSNIIFSVGTVMVLSIFLFLIMFVIVVGGIIIFYLKLFRWGKENKIPEKLGKKVLKELEK